MGVTFYAKRFVHMLFVLWAIATILFLMFRLLRVTPRWPISTRPSRRSSGSSSCTSSASTSRCCSNT